MEHLVPVCHTAWIPIGGSSKLESRTTLIHAYSTTPEIVAASLCSVTHPEGRIGYCEWARRNGRLGAIHNVDDRYDHEIDELMAYLIE
jgi:hypothetical protein